MINYILILVLLLTPIQSIAAQLSLPRDSSGWTIFTPSADSTIVYVAASPTGNDGDCVGYLPSDPLVGSDPINPTGPIKPCATSTRAWQLTHNSMPDWVLFKRGDTFSQQIKNVRNGRSATEPYVIGSYGSSGDRPLFNGVAGSDISYSAFYSGQLRWFAMHDIDFYANTRNPDDPGYVSSSGTSGFFLAVNSPTIVTEGILLEGCRFRYFKSNANIGGPIGWLDGFTLRRNVFEYSYNETNRSQGLEIASINNLVVEENVFNHNGWLIQNYYAGSDDTGLFAGGQATPYNHNMYATNNTNFTVRNNIFIDGSSSNTKIKSQLPDYGVNITVDDNLYIGGEVNISFGDSGEHVSYSTVNPSVTRNVGVHTGRLNSTNREVAWFFYNFNLDGGIFRENLMIHQEDPLISNGGRFAHLQFSGRDVIYENNIIHNVYGTCPIYLNAPDSLDNLQRSGIIFRNNNFDTHDAYIVDATVLANLSGFSFSGNKYNSTKITNTLFNVNGSVLTNAQWATLADDTSTFETATYPDPTRDVDTYMSSIGQTGTIDAFIAAARAQDRYNWDNRLSAAYVNNYIRQGFGLGGQRYRATLAGD